ncbi:MAG TPA: hypothetical protein DIW62_05140 [Raoultella sp.]|nr:hypothetical protein [Raoultella sp.]
MPAMLVRMSEAQSVRQRFFIFIIIIPFCKVQDKTSGKSRRPDTLKILNGEMGAGNYLCLFWRYEI